VGVEARATGDLGDRTVRREAGDVVIQQETTLRTVVVDHVTEPGRTVRHRQPPQWMGEYSVESRDGMTSLA
jgi:hypothetical protein